MSTFPNEETSGGMFVLTNVEMPRNELPFVVHEDIVLREATDKEIALFEEALENTYGFLCSRIADPTKKYKGHVITNGEGNLRLTDEGYQGRKRFWVIAYHGVNNRNKALERVGLLTDPQLIFGFTYICFKPKQQECTGCIFGSHVPVTRFRSDLFEPNKIITLDELKRFRRLYVQTQVDRSAPERASEFLDRYIQTFGFDWESEVLVLLYIGIIESIITHKPDSKDPTDSLVRQVTGKMNLVNNRFDLRIDPESYFVKNKGNLGDFKRMWRNLYEIRSSIIHGGTVSFNSGATAKFESLELVNRYLHDNVRELIKLYFADSDLLKDLKDC